MRKQASPLAFIRLMQAKRLALRTTSSTNLSATVVTVGSSSSSSADDAGDEDSLAGGVGGLSSELDDSWGAERFKLPVK